MKARGALSTVLLKCNVALAHLISRVMSDVRNARNPLLLVSTRDSKFAGDFLSRADTRAVDSQKSYDSSVRPMSLDS